MVKISQVINFDRMNVGKKGDGKHWTKKEVEAREAAAQKVKPKKKVNLKVPSWLDDEAKTVWKKTIKDMKEFEILEKIDEDTLAAYCDAVARHKELSQKINEKGYIVENANGIPTVSPYVKSQQSYMRLILSYSDKLGLNANARARLAKKISEDGDDPNADLFD